MVPLQANAVQLRLDGIFVWTAVRPQRQLTCVLFDDAIHFLVENQETPDRERPGQHLPFEWSIPDNSSIAFDKCFLSAEILCGLTRETTAIS